MPIDALEHLVLPVTRAMSLDGSERHAVPVIAPGPESDRPWPKGSARLTLFTGQPRRRWTSLLAHGYPVTVTDPVEIGPAPAPGNADPVPLNITSVTVYRPGRLYTCVGDGPDPVVPSPNSHR